VDDLHIWTPLIIGKGEGVFTKPYPISDALCAFLGLPAGSKVPRSEVTRKMCTYVKANGLLTGVQKITQDDALRDLLDPAPDLNILNLNRYLRPHYLFEDELGFEAWWTARESPLWVGVNVEGFSAHAFHCLYNTITRYPAVQFVLYTGIPTSDSESPCGCYGYDGVCDYHRDGELDTAICGCSVFFQIICAYHAE
jgi:hypothetical protein